MACELFAAEYRTFAGTIIENFWAVATCFYALLAYLVQNWVHLQLIISLIGLLSIPLYWYVSDASKHTVSNTQLTTERAPCGLRCLLLFSFPRPEAVSK